MQDDVGFHDAHRLYTALDVRHCGAVLREHCQQGHRPEALDKFSTDLFCQATVLCRKCETTLYIIWTRQLTNGVLHSGCCSSYHPAQFGVTNGRVIQRKKNLTLVKIVDNVLDEGAELHVEQLTCRIVRCVPVEYVETDAHRMSNSQNWWGGRNSQLMR